MKVSITPYRKLLKFSKTFIIPLILLLASFWCHLLGKKSSHNFRLPLNAAKDEFAYCKSSIGSYDDGQSALDWFGFTSSKRGNTLNCFHIIPEIKLSYCRNTKVSSTNIIALLTYIMKSKKDESYTHFLKRTNHNFREMWFNKCPTLTTQLLHDDQWIHLFVVRDPVQLFLSAWRYACEAPSRRIARSCCNRNVSCFLPQIYSRLQYLSHTYEEYAKKPEEGIGVDKFAERHFVPQTWFYGLVKSNKTVQDRITILSLDDQDFDRKLLSILKGRPGIDQNKTAMIEAAPNVAKPNQHHHNPNETIANSSYMMVKNLFKDNKSFRDCFFKIYKNDYNLLRDSPS